MIDRQKPELEKAKASLSLNPCDPVVAEVDRIRFEQILTNLLSNAVKFIVNLPLTENENKKT